MDHFRIIQDLVVILSVSLPIIFLFRKINLPSIVGFLLAGIIIGPFGFKLIKSLDQIEVMAEIGVMLLLFTIGLEVSLSQLTRIKKYLFIAGGLQLVLTILISTIIFSFFSIGLNNSIFLGMLVALSSTAIVLKLLSDKGELETPYGSISLSVLIFQDLAIVPLFLMLPLLGADSSLTITEIILKLIVAFATIALILVVAKFLMPKIVYQIARLKMREAFLIGIVLILLGTAYLTHSLGLSFALGAFIAGLILAESDYNHQIVSEILPFRDIFNSIFFVSIGLLLNLGFVVDNPLLIGSATAGVILLKSIIIIAIVLLLKLPLRVAVLAGIGLAQIGEFSFVLALAGTDFNLLPSDYYQTFLATAIFTMILTPFLFKVSPFLAFKSSKLEPSRVKNDEESKQLKGHVIIAGFGLNGSNLARVLKETGIKYVVIEINPDTVKKERKKGESILFGDISKEEVLKSAGIESAKIIVFAISDAYLTRIGLRLVKRLNPGIYALVRTRFISEVDELKKLGADEVIPEEFETALTLFRNVLEKYHIPLNVIMKQVTLLRQESYQLLRKENSDLSSFIHLDEILAQGLTETYFINQDNLFIGKSIAEINLRAQTDATIIAIVREGKTISNPSPKETLLINDTLVITGTHESVDKAIDILDGGGNQ